MADKLIELLYENNVRCDIGIESLAEDIRSIFSNECISKLEIVRILQKAYAEGRIQARDGLVSVLDDINAAKGVIVKEAENDT